MPPKRKRKKSKSSPGSENKGTKKSKNKMADNNTPGQVNTNGSPYVLPQLPPMYHQNPYYMQMNSGSPPMNVQNTNNDVLQTILNRLNTMDAKLNRLDTIQSSVNSITERLNAIDTRIGDVETSQTFISDQHDTLRTKTKEAEKHIGEIRAEVKSLAAENAELKTANKSLVDDVIDLKCRSMRDNLLFFGITEQTRSPEVDIADLPQENCAELVYDFCESVLKINDPKDKISIDRAHRIGRFASDKIRPIVVKFKDTSSKVTVQSTLKAANLKETDYNVSEQYPQEVKERRKVLIPIMVKARSEGKKAVLVREKLYINNVLYSPDTSASK